MSDDRSLGFTTLLAGHAGCRLPRRLTELLTEHGAERAGSRSAAIRPPTRSRCSPLTAPRG